jgi:hypothetical protein
VVSDALRAPQPAQHKSLTILSGSFGTLLPEATIMAGQQKVGIETVALSGQGLMNV